MGQVYQAVAQPFVVQHHVHGTINEQVESDRIHVPSAEAGPGGCANPACLWWGSLPGPASAEGTQVTMIPDLGQ